MAWSLLPNPPRKFFSFTNTASAHLSVEHISCGGLNWGQGWVPRLGGAISFIFSLKNVFIYEGGGEQGEGERIPTRLPQWVRSLTQAQSHDPEIMTWAETKSQMLWLSHPGAPRQFLFMNNAGYVGTAQGWDYPLLTLVKRTLGPHWTEFLRLPPLYLVEEQLAVEVCVTSTRSEFGFIIGRLSRPSRAPSVKTKGMAQKEKECRQALGMRETHWRSSPVSSLFVQGCTLSPHWIAQSCVMIGLCSGRGT